MKEVVLAECMLVAERIEEVSAETRWLCVCHFAVVFGGRINRLSKGNANESGRGDGEQLERGERGKRRAMCDFLYAYA